MRERSLCDSAYISVDSNNSKEYLFTVHFEIHIRFFRLLKQTYRDLQKLPGRSSIYMFLT